jgi:hypothetical protein
MNPEPDYGFRLPRAPTTQLACTFLQANERCANRLASGRGISPGVMLLAGLCMPLAILHAVE